MEEDFRVEQVIMEVEVVVQLEVVVELEVELALAPVMEAVDHFMGLAVVLVLKQEMVPMVP
jgi:hypothetical protein